ncbi:MAG: ATP-binding cassette domain-containing protein, partial [Deltaproteobacteria bacterium]|nr:ATP-binding cassette domain-containing protein [Deltaproteobacteria bacterium]
MAPRPGSARRLLSPEVIQTSAMDCGPAALKCLLEGFGIHASYGRLREACQTDVDGTSIDTLEEIACQLGLEAQQIMVPANHLLRREARSLPALVVVSLPNGFTHFVVAWRTHGPLVQVMDPGNGRRWMSRARFRELLYLHTHRVPAKDWRDHAGSPEFLEPLSARMTELGLPAARLCAEACADSSWRALAALDACVRLTESLTAGKAVRRGSEASRLVESLLAVGRSDPAALLEQVPEGYWFARPAPRRPEEPAPAEEMLAMRGAVLVQVQGQRPRTGAASEPERALLPRLAAVLDEPPERPLGTLLRMVRQDGVLAPIALAAASLAAAGGTLVEGLLLRGVVDAAWMLPLGLQRLGAAATVLGFLLLTLLLEHRLASGLRGLGRRLEARFRIAFLSKLPRLGDRYFHSRPVSDMAARGHSMSLLRTFPNLGGQLTRSVAELVVLVAGISWLDPPSAPAVVAIAVGCVAIPAAAQRWLTEQEMRLRVHAGVLSRFYLDALLGLFAVRAHGAERSVRTEHEAMLVEWARTGYAMQRVVVALQALEAALGAAAAIALMAGYLQRSGGVGSALLLIYWTLSLPVVGSQIAILLQQWPGQRNAALRILEPLGAPDEEAELQEDVPALAPAAQLGTALGLHQVRVVAGGHTILEDVTLSVAPGAHVAVVGRSGAGKSSLLGLLLGWHTPAAGEVLVDGATLDRGRLARLREQTTWVDPSVQLWNRTLAENLRYGTSGGATSVGCAVEAADLKALLEKLPCGLQTSLGAGGGLVSGGEGQRVRLGRAMARRDARLVLLDEPFRGLDRAQRGPLLLRARAHWTRATLFGVTHDIEHTLSFARVL